MRLIEHWYGWEREVAEKVVEIQNEALASFCAARPDRFCALASVTLQAPELAVAQLEKAVRRQGLRGVAVGANVAGVEFSDPRFHSFWSKCEELGVVVFIHPGSTPELATRFKGNGILANTIGNPLDTTIALSHLIFTPEAMRHLGAEIGYERIVLGTDYPYPWQPDALQLALDAPGATEAQKRAMVGETAAKLLGLAAG